MPLRKIHIDLLKKYLPKEAETAVSFGYPEFIGVSDSYKFLKKHLGVDLIAYDIKNYGNDEIYFDLNQPPTGGKKFDLAINPGTLEHCFNISNALANITDFCKPGGLIMHHGPFQNHLHGLWEAHPKLFQRYYGKDNILCHYYLKMSKNDGKIVDKKNATSQVLLVKNPNHMNCLKVVYDSIK